MATRIEEDTKGGVKIEPEIRDALKRGTLYLHIAGFATVFILSFVGALMGSGLMLAIGILDILVFLFIYFPGLITIPITFVGVLEWVEERTNILLNEGLHWVFPYFHRVTTLSAKLTKNDIHALVSCADLITLDFIGDLQYRIGKGIGDRQGRNRLIEQDETIIQTGIDAAVEQELRFVGGRNPSLRFIDSQEGISLLIQSVLMLKEMPHRDPDFIKFCEERGTQARCANFNLLQREIKKQLKRMGIRSIREATLKDFEQARKEALRNEGVWTTLKSESGMVFDIDSETRLDFYEKNKRAIAAWIDAPESSEELIMRLFRQMRHDSPIEKRYGIECIFFALKRVVFDDPTRAAQQAGAQIKMYEDAVQPDTSADPAGTRMALLGKASQRNLNIMGLSTALAAFGKGIGEGISRRGNKEGDQ